MIKTIIGFIALLIVGGIAVYMGNTQTYEQETQVATTTIEVEKEVDVLEARIQAAIEAKMPEIEALAQKAYNDRITVEKAEIEASVLSEYEAEIKARRVEKEKEAGSY